MTGPASDKSRAGVAGAGGVRGLGASMSQSMHRMFARVAPALRPIGSERAADCARLHERSFAFFWGEADFEQLLTTAEVVADGADAAVEPDGRLCGMLLSRVAADEAEILTIAVAPERRRAGLGAALLRAHLPRLRARFCAKLFLEVEASNAAAKALYAAAGFHQIAERKAYYRKEGAAPATALLMRLDFAP
ncbi:GNAT family N-acetyltransferase [Methylocella sp.]|uniref:GNAT family N-acetyltransferase n=1 Tax=Methylocella sp. TaxID=1978226 RepID=UPI003784F4A9